jgi:hypothetical protein
LNSRLFIMSFVVVCLVAGPVFGETTRLQGTISDESGQPVAAAELFVYDSPKTRRPADYISPRTGADGRYVLNLPPGKYWGVARVRHSEKYGPLLSGDLHSGEPKEVDLAAGDHELDFMVADIRDLARAKEKRLGSMPRVTGRVLSNEGRPVASAFLSVWAAADATKLPVMVSAWTEPNGEYSIFLPPGSYAVAASTTFPPPISGVVLVPLTVPEGEKMVAFDIQLSKIEGYMTSEAGNQPVDGMSLEDE